MIREFRNDHGLNKVLTSDEFLELAAKAIDAKLSMAMVMNPTLKDWICDSIGTLCFYIFGKKEEKENSYEGSEMDEYLHEEADNILANISEEEENVED